MKNLFSILAILFLFVASATPVHAEWPAVAGTSAIPSFAEITVDKRPQQLKTYFDTHNSPLANEAAFIVSEADRLNLDWKLVAAISGTESTFGKRIPPNSYNAWGWAIYTGQSDGRHFSSWKEGITTVSEGLRYNYMDKGAKSIEQIGRIYAASPRWSQNTRFFLNAIDTFTPKDASLLAITL